MRRVINLILAFLLLLCICCGVIFIDAELPPRKTVQYKTVLVLYKNCTDKNLEKIGNKMEKEGWIYAESKAVSTGYCFTFKK